MKISVIIACGGTGSRTGLQYNKLKFDIGGMPIIQKTISAFSRDDISSIILAVNRQDLEWFNELVSSLHNENIKVCLGGLDRQESIFNALQMVDEDTDLVMIHDGARPFVSQKVIDEAIEGAIKRGTAVACIDETDSLRQFSEFGSTPVDRKEYVRVQTPQVFRYDQILKAYKMAKANFGQFTDDASLYQEYIGDVYITRGSPANIKITTKEDIAKFIPQDFFVGVGWDTHELVEGRKLILGGVTIPHTKGLLGHSDADVLTHAIMDALLSASHNKDIGQLFPDTDDRYKGISSILLLKEVVIMIKDQGYTINNVSAVIMAQKPKMASYIPLIQVSLAEAMGIDESKVCVSATTTEKLGLVGHEEAISSNAYVSLYKKEV